MPDTDARAGAENELDRRLLDFIRDGIGTFEAFALEVFAHQFALNPVYRAWCLRRGSSPETVADWRAIPAVPTSAFKSADIVTFAIENAAAEFRTSGTTVGRPGTHFFQRLDLYDTGALRHFQRMMLPDGARPKMVALTPSPQDAPHSSLVHMIARVMDAFDPTGRFFVRRSTAGAEPTADFPAFEAALRDLARIGEPVCVMGTAFAFVHWLESAPTPVALAPGSRVMETGGFKGRSREVPRAELYEGISRALGVPVAGIVAEYGMTELSSQYYDDCLLRGDRADAGRRKVPPHWMRAIAVDPETLAELPAGEVGLLRHIDLANLGSCIAVQTEDLGRVLPDGIELMGRAPGAEPRGCSRALDELMTGVSAR